MRGLCIEVKLTNTTSIYVLTLPPSSCSYFPFSGLSVESPTSPTRSPRSLQHIVFRALIFTTPVAMSDTYLQLSSAKESIALELLDRNAHFMITILVAIDPSTQTVFVARLGKNTLLVYEVEDGEKGLKAKQCPWSEIKNECFSPGWRPKRLKDDLMGMIVENKPNKTKSNLQALLKERKKEQTEVETSEEDDNKKGGEVATKNKKGGKKDCGDDDESAKIAGKKAAGSAKEKQKRK